MGTQILTGSRGFKVYTNNPDKCETKFFTVTQDTCCESDKIPVKFDDKKDKEVMVRLKTVSFTKKRTCDY